MPRFVTCFFLILIATPLQAEDKPVDVTTIHAEAANAIKADKKYKDKTLTLTITAVRITKEKDSYLIYHANGASRGRFLIGAILKVKKGAEDGFADKALTEMTVKARYAGVRETSIGDEGYVVEFDDCERVLSR